MNRREKKAIEIVDKIPENYENISAVEDLAISIVITLIEKLQDKIDILEGRLNSIETYCDISDLDKIIKNDK